MLTVTFDFRTTKREDRDNWPRKVIEDVPETFIGDERVIKLLLDAEEHIALGIIDGAQITVERKKQNG